jgi:hypothetical protein
MNSSGMDLALTLMANNELVTDNIGHASFTVSAPFPDT